MSHGINSAILREVNLDSEPTTRQITGKTSRFKGLDISELRKSFEHASNRSSLSRKDQLDTFRDRNQADFDMLWTTVGMTLLDRQGWRNSYGNVQWDLSKTKALAILELRSDASAIFEATQEELDQHAFSETQCGILQ